MIFEEINIVKRSDSMDARKKAFTKIKELLIERKDQIIEEARKSLSSDSIENATHGDNIDIANYKTDTILYSRIRDRERKLIKKINKALEKLENNQYGICEKCGKEISTERLEIRPVTEYCITCKEILEQEED